MSSRVLTKNQKSLARAKALDALKAAKGKDNGKRKWVNLKLEELCKIARIHYFKANPPIKTKHYLA